MSRRPSATIPRYVSPLRYPGGKAKMASSLSEIWQLQVGYLDMEVWLEPFAGGAGAGLTMLAAGTVEELWLTEKNPAIAALWRTILSDGGALAERVERFVPTMDTWHEARDTLERGTVSAADDHALAMAALVVNRCSRSGIVHPSVGPIGGARQDGRWHVGSRWNGPALAARLRLIASLSARIRFDEGDAIERLRELDGSAGIEDEMLIFVDPPYIREGNRLYANGMSEENHRELARALANCPARWLVTYDDEPVVSEDLYRDFRVLSYGIPNSANKARAATEFAVLSDNLELPDGIELVPGRATQMLARDAVPSAA